MKMQAIGCFFLILTGPFLASASHYNNKEHKKESSWSYLACSLGKPVVAGAGAVVAAPLVIGALGFGAGGVVANSLASKAMALFGTEGTVISTLQSVGAAGFSPGAKFGIWTLVSGVTYFFNECDDDEDKKGEDTSPHLYPVKAV